MIEEHASQRQKPDCAFREATSRGLMERMNPNTSYRICAGRWSDPVGIATLAHRSWKNSLFPT